MVVSDEVLLGNAPARYDKFSKCDKYTTDFGQASVLRSTGDVVEACISVKIKSDEFIRLSIRIYDGEFQVSRDNMYGVPQYELTSPDYKYKCTGTPRISPATVFNWLMDDDTDSRMVVLVEKALVGMMSSKLKLSHNDNKVLQELLDYWRNPINS